MEINSDAKGEVKTSFVERYPELLNLGKDDVKVYKFLDEAGECSAKVISARTDISYSGIHEVLYRLQQEGLIIRRGETPKLFSLRFKDPERPKLWPARQQGGKKAPGGK